MQTNQRRKLRRLVGEIRELAQETGLPVDEKLDDILSAAKEPSRDDHKDPRHVVRKLDTFTVTELADAMGRSRPTAEKEVKELLDRGVIRDSGMRRKHSGPGRPAPVYEYVRAEAKITARPKRVPVEVEVSQRFHEPRRNGHGKHKKRRKINNPEVRELVRVAEANGCRVSSGGGHLSVYAPSGKIVTLPSTPSDHRTVLNCRSQMRRAGIPV